MLVGDGIGDVDFVFHPVGVFLETESLHVYGVVRVVVDSSHCAELVESFDQHSFRIEIGESQRTCDVGHAALFSPVFDGLDECG